MRAEGLLGSGASGGACPCGGGAAYALCCGRYHDGPLALQAPDPQALMRSRYSAFVLDRRDYLMATWHASERPQCIEPPEPGLKWLGLSVRSAGLREASQGWVSFVARYKIGGRAHRLVEVSRLVWERGCWWYVGAVAGTD